MSINQNIPKYRVIFMGTPEFSAPGLKRLLAAPEFETIGIFTQPDKPVGRKQTLIFSPIKKIALENKIKVYQPEKIRTETETIKSLKPDLIVVIAYGKIITPEILAIPTFACINVHASLLPKYRGAACLNAPIINGDKETGVTIMKMEAGLDTGPILRQAKIKLNGLETLTDVHDQLSELGAKLLVSTLLDHIGGKIKQQTQDDTQASYIKILKKEDGRLDLNKNAVEIERMIRAYNPWPGTYTEINGETLKIIAVENKVVEINKVQVNQLFLDNGCLLIQCGQDALAIIKLQLAGKKIMTSKEFINGYQHLIAK